MDRRLPATNKRVVARVRSGHNPRVIDAQVLTDAGVSTREADVLSEEQVDQALKWAREATFITGETVG